ncbi:MAG TPA: hypothetical protein VMD97_08380 [Candidatus Aquilonibacter sp.]|nr:hypothetical protein [Candidatus Aquilonibacter sp.]
MLPLLAALSPNAAIVILTIGLILVAIELNRPGMILPGAVGLLFTLVALAVLLHDRPRPLAFGLFLAAATVLLLQLRRNVAVWIVCLGTAAGILGLALLPRASLPVALSCGLVLGTGTTVLTRIARRARQNKGLD